MRYRAAKTVPGAKRPREPLPDPDPAELGGECPLDEVRGAVIGVSMVTSTGDGRSGASPTDVPHRAQKRAPELMGS